MIQFACECGRLLQAQDQFAGQRTKCPICGREMNIPTPAAVAAKAAAPVPPPPPPKLAAPPPPPDRVQKKAAPRPADKAAEPRNERPVAVKGPGYSWQAVVALIAGLLSPCLSPLAVLAAFGFGIWGLKAIRGSQGQLKGSWMALVGMALSLMGFLVQTILIVVAVWFVHGETQELQNKQTAAKNLHDIGRAMELHHDALRYFPASSAGAGGAPPVSWRVQLLPYLEENSLFQKYDFKEPWNGPNNSKLLERMPKVYQVPGTESKTKPGHTYYQVFDEPSAVVFTDSRIRMRDITDGTAATLLVVEAAEAVPWTKPQDISYDPTRPPPKLGGHFKGGFHAVFADGTVRFVKDDVSERTLKALITRAGGEVVSPPGVIVPPPNARPPR